LNYIQPLNNIVYVTKVVLFSIFFCVFTSCKPYEKPDILLSPEDRLFQESGHLFGKELVLLQAEKSKNEDKITPNNSLNMSLDKSFFWAALDVLKKFTIEEVSVKEGFIQTKWYNLNRCCQIKVLFQLKESKKEAPFFLHVLGKRLQESKWISYTPLKEENDLRIQINLKAEQFQEKKQVP